MSRLSAVGSYSRSAMNSPLTLTPYILRDLVPECREPGLIWRIPRQRAGFDEPGRGSKRAISM